MKILVTGAGGLVGGLIVRLARGRHQVLGCNRTQFDILDRKGTLRVIREFSPDTVLHCAAYTDVDGAEREPEKAMEINAAGSRVVAESAREVGALILYVSSDYVFDGMASVPYREEDPTGPLSSYGRSKLAGERAVAEACPEAHAIVRTGWLYGPGKGFVDWARHRLLEQEELPLVQDRTGSPTSAQELAAALVVLAEGRHRGLFHFVNAGEATWLRLGEAVAEELKVPNPRIRAISFDSLNRPAPRPRYSSLAVDHFEKATGRAVRGWREALHHYLAA
ncbi:MAG TPA: dTDP-4-dehydrorhamnose reductase [Vicinamibacteria bacterium]|jgi:dTDP-4-dehydrorhamnose reductase